MQPRTTSARGWVNPAERKYPTSRDAEFEFGRILSLKPQEIYVLPIMKKPDWGWKHISDPNNPFNYAFSGPEVYGCDFSTVSLFDHDPNIPWINQALRTISANRIGIMRDMLICLSPDVPPNDRWMIDMAEVGPPDKPDQKWKDIRMLKLGDENVQHQEIMSVEKSIREGTTRVRLDAAHMLRSKHPWFLDRLFNEIRRKFSHVGFMAETLGCANPAEMDDYFTGIGCDLLGNFHWEVMWELNKEKVENYFKNGRRNAIDFVSTHDDIPEIISHSNDEDARAYSNCLLYMLALAKQGKWGLMQGFETMNKTPQADIMGLNTYDFSWPGAKDLSDKITWLSTLRSIYPAFNFGWTDFWSVNNDTVSCFMRGIDNSYKLFCAVNLTHDSDNCVEVLMPENFTLFEINDPRIFPEPKDILPRDENGYVKIRLGHPNHTAARVFLVKETP